MLATDNGNIYKICDFVTKRNHRLFSFHIAIIALISKYQYLEITVNMRPAARSYLTCQQVHKLIKHKLVHMFTTVLSKLGFFVILFFILKTIVFLRRGS